MSERTRYASVLETLRLTSVRYGGVFVASRALNGALALLQVLLVTEAVGPADAGRFFLLWTAAWLLSVVVKFGADGILPRGMAEARLAGSDRVSMRRVALVGMAAAALLAPAVMLLLEIPFAPVEIALLAGLAVVGGGLRDARCPAQGARPGGPVGRGGKCPLAAGAWRSRPSWWGIGSRWRTG